MSAPDAAPLPRRGEVFFDVRGSARSMRLSWYADTDVAVFSIWQAGTCTGTFRLSMADLPRMIEALSAGPDGNPAQQPPDYQETETAYHGDAVPGDGQWDSYGSDPHYPEPQLDDGYHRAGGRTDFTGERTRSFPDEHPRAFPDGPAEAFPAASTQAFQPEPPQAFQPEPPQAFQPEPMRAFAGEAAYPASASWPGPPLPPGAPAAVSVPYNGDAVPDGEDRPPESFPYGPPAGYEGPPAGS